MALQLENRELLVGDCLGLVCFCVYKQVRLPVLCALRPGRLCKYVRLHVQCACSELPSPAPSTVWLRPPPCCAVPDNSPDPLAELPGLGGANAVQPRAL